MIWSQTDRQERTYPPEVYFPYRTRRGYTLVRPAPRSVVHRSALTSKSGGDDAYARELLGDPRGVRKPVAPRRSVARASKPVKPVDPQAEYEAAMKELAKAEAEVKKAEAALAALNK